MTIDFVERVPACKPLTGEVHIKWHHAKFEHILFWQARIQKVIANDSSRADADWNWFELYALALVHKIRRQQPLVLAAVVDVPGKGFIPVGMLMALTEYPHIDNTGKKAVFTYFLSSAPRQALEPLGVATAPSLGRALVDTAIVLSNVTGKGGRVWLHCSPKGKERLMRFYEDTVRLLRYPTSAPIPSTWALSANDGRCFYADEKQAAVLANDLNHLRPK